MSNGIYHVKFWSPAPPVYDSATNALGKKRSAIHKDKMKRK